MPDDSPAQMADPQPPYGAAALCRIGAARRAAGYPAIALELQERAISLDPALAAAWAEAGLALLALGRRGEAMARLRRALFLAPGLPGARVALGLELLRRHQHAAAAEQFAEGLQAAPDDWTLHHNLGLARQHQGRHADAAASFAAATRLAPREPEPVHALGTALHLTNRPDAAAAAYRQALTLRPDWAEALGNLGCALRAVGEPEQAVASYDRALALRPTFAEARWNRALGNLSLGRLAQAWDDHEWRWQVPGFPCRPRGFPQPLWNGEDIAGRRILLHGEQGFGDTLQALRYVPMVAARGAEVVLEVPCELLRLAETVAGASVVLAQGDALPAYDVQAPLLSLPRAFGTTLDSIPAEIGYLSPPATSVAAWRARLAPLPRPRVGLVWAGRPTHGNDANRSLPFAALAPLLAIPGLRFVSLQIGPRAADLASLPPGSVHDLSPALTDFAESAAALLALDVLVSVDTSAVHLAGALGRPVHVLLPFAPDWRWLLGRDDSPWYPSVRLHRQTEAGDWSAPLASVAAALRRLAASPHHMQAA